MQIALISDIHANLPALEAVLAAIDEAGIERRWCLGDVVGYGAQPDECAQLVAERCELSLVGNHDLAVTGEISTDVFSASAAAAVEWTRQNCDPKTIEFLKELKPENTEHEVGLYHASPRDPVWEYVLAVDQARECIAEQSARVSLIGHSHVALWFSDGAGPAASRSIYPSPAGCSIRVVPGSLGTGIRARPGWSSTRTSGKRFTTASPTTSTKPRGRSEVPGYPNCSPTGCTWANDRA
jgi:predicted phosphodiesterase